jgi:Domain of Unknown Function (DUF928)
MKTLKFIPWFILTMGLVLAISACVLVFGLQPVQAEDIVYKPPVTTAPVRRVGAGSRGPSRDSCQPLKGIDKTFVLQVLAPDTLGQTRSAQPTLYWWVSNPVSGKFIFTVTDGSERFREPLLNFTKTLSVNVGVHSLSMAENNISLKPDTNYTWSVSLECDATNPSLNVISTGIIKYVAPRTELDKRFKQAPPEKLPYLYAISSYWYDSLSSLAELIQKMPSDRKWREVRTNLLRQGGLDKVATGGE